MGYLEKAAAEPKDTPEIQFLLAGIATGTVKPGFVQYSAARGIFQPLIKEDFSGVDLFVVTANYNKEDQVKRAAGWHSWLESNCKLVDNHRSVYQWIVFYLYLSLSFGISNSYFQLYLLVIPAKILLTHADKNEQHPLLKKDEIPHLCIESPQHERAIQDPWPVVNFLLKITHAVENRTEKKINPTGQVKLYHNQMKVWWNQLGLNIWQVMLFVVLLAFFASKIFP